MPNRWMQKENCIISRQGLDSPPPICASRCRESSLDILFRQQTKLSESWKPRHSICGKLFLMVHNMTTKRIHLFISAVIWGLFLIAFIGFGYSATPLLPDTSNGLITAGSQYATTDIYLGILRVPRPSEYIQSALAALPSKDPILFVGSGNDPNFEPRYQVISYLSLPRQVYILGCGRPGQPPRQYRWAQTPPEGMKIAGVMFYGMEPPSSLPSARAIGPSLKLVPASETTKWTSYCF